MSFYTLPQNLKSEFKDLEQLIADFNNKLITPDQFKHDRVPFGVYEQRKCGTYMMRIRTPGGAITPAQLKKVGELSDQYGSGRVHVTTRQEVQIHDVTVEHIIPVMESLLEVGLSTRGGGGNTVRNITASHDSGLNQSEAFDVQPYVTALTNHFVKSGDSWKLPRKLKIAFASAELDNINAKIQDLGFVARTQNGQNGFKVYIAGGMGARPAFGKVLLDFVPAEKVVAVGQAIKMLFFKYGNRKNRNRARMRFLWDALGEEQFRTYFEEELNEAKKNSEIHLTELESFHAPEDIPVEPVQTDSADYRQWLGRYVKKQKQPDLVSIKVPLVLGDLSGSDTQKLGEQLMPFGDNIIRFSIGQDIYLRNIPKTHLGNIYFILKEIKTNSKKPVLFSQMVTCTGASTCKLGICLSRGATPAIQSALEQSTVNTDLLDQVKIHISGCSNSCAQHVIGDLGFFGRIKRQNGRAFPAYSVIAGARVNGTEKRFAIKAGWVASHDLPKAITAILGAYQLKLEQYPSFADYIDGPGLEVIESICRDFQSIPEFEVDQSYYVDWGAKEPFSVKEIGQGECAAGLADLIESDLNQVETLTRAIEKGGADEQKHFQVVKLASQALLAAKGIESKDEAGVFQQFIETFIDTALFDEAFGSLLEAAKNHDYKTLKSNQHSLLKFKDAVLHYYRNPDQNFSAESETLKDENDQKSGQPKDFRHVKCPLNFAKIKVALLSIPSGETMEFLIDDGEPIKNVPPSLLLEGHKILSQKKTDDYWSIVIRKG